MPKTGNIFTDIFSVVCIVSALIPAGIIFLRKIYRNESLNFLMILCLLGFVKYCLLFVPQLNSASQNIISSMFNLFEFVILIQLSKTALPAIITRLLNILVACLLSAIVTFYLLEGVGQKVSAFEIIQCTILILVSIICLAQLIEKGSLHILHEPLFWISTGILFYFSISLLMQGLSAYYAQMSKESQMEREILMGAGSLAKYFFFTLAAIFYRDSSGDIENLSSF